MKLTRKSLIARALNGVALTATTSVVVLSLAACTQAAAKRVKADSGETFEEDPTDPILQPPRPPDYNNDDSGAFDIPERKNQAPSDGGTRTGLDGGKLDAGLKDGGVALCPGPLAPGDIKVVEIMISSVTGSGDMGEWVELQSTRSCRLNVKGVTISSPRGATATDSVTVTEDLILPPAGSFIVAGSTDPAVNHGLTGPVFAWPTGDVLKNDGDTIDIKSGSVVIDTLTYPHFSTATAGRSISFPASCAWSDRASWTRWSYSFDHFSGTFQGTPNKDNVDVACY